MVHFLCIPSVVKIKARRAFLEFLQESGMSVCLSVCLRVCLSVLFVCLGNCVTAAATFDAAAWFIVGDNENKRRRNKNKTAEGKEVSLLRRVIIFMVNPNKNGSLKDSL